MKIGLIKETKVPVDNRVALTPAQVRKLMDAFPGSEFVVESSDVRAYSDKEYEALSIPVVTDLTGCDYLFGIKEAKIETLIPDKHYFFFGHIAKMQKYNKPLLQAMMAQRISFTDYEYLVDDSGGRVCAFGWWAGVVGVYYTLRGYALKHQDDSLPKPGPHFTKDELVQLLRSYKKPAVKILITGTGRVSSGAQYVLKEIGATQMSEEEFLSSKTVPTLSYCVAPAERLVKRKDRKPSTLEDLIKHPKWFDSDFMKWARSTDILMCCHFWSPEAPVYLSQQELQDPSIRIKMIGDVTCDIMGSVKSTLRSSTHANPYYDYNPATCLEEPAFSSERNISVMAVDTCPNALAMDTSAYFGEMLIKHVFVPLLEGEDSTVINSGTILCNGGLTPKFDYLKGFAEKD